MITMDAGMLADMVQAVKAFVAPETKFYPILQMVRLTATVEGGLTVTATNVALGIRYHMDVAVTEPFDGCVKFALFAKWVKTNGSSKKARKMPVLLTREERRGKDCLVINNTVSGEIEPWEEFPVVPFIAEGVTQERLVIHEMDQVVGVIERMGHLKKGGDKRDVDASDVHIWMLNGDGFRSLFMPGPFVVLDQAYVTLPFDVPKRFAIPSSTVATIKAALKDGSVTDGEITWWKNEHRHDGKPYGMAFRAANVTIYFQTHEVPSNVDKYLQALEDHQATVMEATFKMKDWKRAYDPVKALAKEANKLELAFMLDQGELTATVLDKASVTSSLCATSTGTAAWQVDPSLLATVLDATTAEVVTFALKKTENDIYQGGIMWIREEGSPSILGVTAFKVKTAGKGVVAIGSVA